MTVRSATFPPPPPTDSDFAVWSVATAGAAADQQSESSAVVSIDPGNDCVPDVRESVCLREKERERKLCACVEGEERERKRRETAY